MMKFLYWNLNKKVLEEVVVSMVHANDIDVIVLSEPEGIDRSNLLIKLNKSQMQLYGLNVSPIDDPLVISRLPSQSIENIGDRDHVSIKRIVPPLGKDMLLIAVHMPSKLYYDEDDQFAFSIRLMDDIAEIEGKLNHKRTVVVGDFNMNPFEKGMIAGDELHAVMDRTVARKESRIIGSERKYFFYNPMWNLFGDIKEPVGTYYYDNSSRQKNYYWNIYDQVIVRPALIDYFDEMSLEIIREAGGRSLVNKRGLPDKGKYSDHLPLVFKINVIKEGLI